MIASIKNILRRTKQGVLLAPLRRLMLRSPFFATLAYLRNKDFQLEAWAYFHGLQQVRDSSDNSIGWRYRLRTNTHIIEKGLAAVDRRSVFGAKLAREAVADFRRLHELQSTCAATEDEPLYVWSRDVLTTYFSVTGSEPRIDAARNEFRKLDLQRAPTGESLTPFARGAHGEEDCSYDQLMALARRRRSVRGYLPDKVPHDLIDKAMAIAALSPSACNRQPFHYRIIDDPSMIEQLKDIPGGITCFNHLPALIVLTGDMRGCVESITNRHTIYVDACLSAMAFQLALETLGLSSCCVNWSEMVEKDARVRGLLKMPPYERVVMFMVVGFPMPEAVVPRSHKKHLANLRSFNAIGPQP